MYKYIQSLYVYRKHEITLISQKSSQKKFLLPKKNIFLNFCRCLNLCTKKIENLARNLKL